MRACDMTFKDYLKDVCNMKWKDIQKMSKDEKNIRRKDYNSYIEDLMWKEDSEMN